MSTFALYGGPAYGTVPYGKSPQIGVTPTVFLSPLLMAEPVDTGSDRPTIKVTLQLPYNNLTTPIYTQMLLVRNNYNIPYNASDGVVLLNYSSAAAISAASALNAGRIIFLDSEAVHASDIEQFNYYSVFLWDGTVWQRSADAQSLLPAQWGYGERMFQLLPQVYRDLDYSGTLEEFLGLLGFQLDYLRTYIETLRNISDPLYMAGDLLPLLAQSLGLQNEPFLGMKLTREQVANIVHLYKTKGSVAGVLDMVSTFVEYGSQIQIGQNLLLDATNSEFAHGLGLWLDITPNEESVWWQISPNPPVVGFPAPISVPVGSADQLDPAYVTSTAAVIYFPTNAQGPMNFSSIGGSTFPGGPPSTPLSGGVPVVPFDPYTFSIYVWQAGLAFGTSVRLTPRPLNCRTSMLSPTALTATTPVNGTNNITQINPGALRTIAQMPSPTVTVGGGATPGHQFILSINWYDQFANPLGSTNSPATGIQAQNSQWDRLSVTGTSPAGAAWASFSVKTQDSLGSNDPVYLGWAQFEDGNLLPANMASFETTGPVNWSTQGAISSSVVAVAPGSPLYPAPDGSSVLSVSYDATTIVSLLSPFPVFSANAIPVQSGYTYTIVGSVQTANYARQVSLNYFWYGGTPGVNAFFITEGGDSFEVAPGAWTNVSYSVMAPPGATSMYVSWSASATDTIHSPAPEVLSLDALGIFVGANQPYTNTPSPYVNARDIQLHFSPLRSNLVTNPSFEADALGSMPSYWGSLTSTPFFVQTSVINGSSTFPVVITPAPLRTRAYVLPIGSSSITATGTSATVITAQTIRTAASFNPSTIPFTITPPFGNNFLRVVSNSIGQGGLQTLTFPIYNPGVHHTLSFYAQAKAIPAELHYLIAFRNIDGGVTGKGGAGYTLSPLIQTFTDTVGSWNRYDSSLYEGSNLLIPPVNAAFATVLLLWHFTTVGEVHYLDGVMFEPSQVAQPYFDGAHPAPGMNSQDIFWAGQPNRSQSFYFPDFTVRQSRLTSLLPDFTPLGSTFSFNYRQPLPVPA